MVADDGSDIISSNENVSPNGGRIAGGTVFSAGMELDLAYSSEKLLNLEMLMMQVSDLTSDYEILIKGPEELLMESIDKTFQFDILSGYLNSEVKEIESFMSSLQLNIMDAHKKFTESDHHVEDSLLNIEGKLHNAEESLRYSQDLVADIRKQSDKFEKFLTFGFSRYEELENGEFSSMNSKWKLQTVEQQRHFLLSLEKSLARELDFEKKLSESRYNEEALKIKLQIAEQNRYYLEELIELMMVKMFTAENYVEVLLGQSEEFMSKLQNGQFSSITSTTLEWEGKSNMEKGFTKLSAEEVDPMNSRSINFGSNGFLVSPEIDLRTKLKEVELKCSSASSEALTLREKVNALEEQLRETESQLQLAKASVRERNNQHNVFYHESGNMESIIQGLKENVLEMQIRTENAEAQYAQLMKANVDLNDEVVFLRSNGAEKANCLERKLKESDMQLEHANASVEAIEEQQKMLYTSLNDMEHLIEDLKGKVSKAENRAESAETKCTVLADTNLELNEELNFLRGRLESLEAVLHQADMEKIDAVKDIGNRTRLIIQLVKKLAFERERLQSQISVLTNRNKILTEKCMRSENNLFMNHEKVYNSADHGTYDETFTESLSTRSQVDGPIVSSTTYEMKLDPAVSAEEAVPNIELVRTIDAAQLNRKYFLMAFILLLLSITAVFFIPT